MKKLFHPLLLLATLCLALTYSPLPSHAASASAKDAVNEVVSLNKQAYKALLSRKYDTAKGLLLKALVIGKDAKLDAHDSLARTYIHLAVVVLGRQKDRNRMVRVFHQALNINPNITITPGLESPALKTAYLQARRELGLPPKPDLHAPAPTALPSSGAPSRPEPATQSARDPVAESPMPARSPDPVPVKPARNAHRGSDDSSEPNLPPKVNRPLHCPLPFDIPPDEDLTIRCITQKHASTSTATVYYRSEASTGDGFTELPMDRSRKGWLVATIPASAVTGKSLAYYIEAQLPDGSEKFMNGRPNAPNAFSIREGAEVEETNEDDDPLRKIAISNAEEEDRRLYHRRLPGALFLSISAGVGAGYHTEEYLDSGARNASQIKAGYTSAALIKAPAGFTPAKVGQIEAEFGIQFSKRFWMSALARYQYSPGYSSGGKAPGEKPILTSAIAGYVRANYALATWGNFQPYASLGVGAGKHFLLYFPETCKEATPENNCTLDHSDTLSGGVGAVTMGLGFIYHLSRGFAIFLEGKEIATLPKFMALSEVNLGMAFAINLLGEKSQSSRGDDEEEEEEEEEPFNEEEQALEEESSE